MGIKTLFHHYFENNMRPSLAVETSLKALGSNLKIARLRRRLPQSQVAERAGISLNFCRRLLTDNNRQILISMI